MTDEKAHRTPGSAAPEPRHGLGDLAEEVLPALIARLRASGLGELEVRTDGWRIRLRRDLAGARERSAAAITGSSRMFAADVPAGSVARSPAVGYFDSAPSLVVGAAVRTGDLLGTIDVLGISQDVTAPSDGIISSVLADDGQAVEYGQALANIEPVDVSLLSDDDRAEEDGATPA